MLGFKLTTPTPKIGQLIFSLIHRFSSLLSGFLFFLFFGLWSFLLKAIVSLSLIFSYNPRCSTKKFTLPKLPLTHYYPSFSFSFSFSFFLYHFFKKILSFLPSQNFDIFFFHEKKKFQPLNKSATFFFHIKNLPLSLSSQGKFIIPLFPYQKLCHFSFLHVKKSIIILLYKRNYYFPFLKIFKFLKKNATASSLLKPYVPCKETTFQCGQTFHPWATRVFPLKSNFLGKLRFPPCKISCKIKSKEQNRN